MTLIVGITVGQINVELYDNPFNQNTFRGFDMDGNYIEIKPVIDLMLNEYYIKEVDYFEINKPNEIEILVPQQSLDNLYLPLPNFNYYEPTINNLP